jgi:hypothetical protein
MEPGAIDYRSFLSLPMPVAALIASVAVSPGNVAVELTLQVWRGVICRPDRVPVWQSTDAAISQITIAR